jgi:hypothetical protein
MFLAPDGSVKDIGEHTWHNGYNGVACAEHYLRSGDESVLPILQYYCDDARKRQMFGIGWAHWGGGANPAYEAGGGMMHCAGNQVLLTLLLGKMCGVDVDDKTLLGALRHWYRFVGHSAIPLADQRCWHIFRSAGRDGATACVMHVASQAKGDVTIYRKAREYLAMSALTSWPDRAYNWEVYWHSLAGHFMLVDDPDLYHTTMRRFRWFHDLGRQASGAFYGHVDHPSLEPADLGISLALAYTAPLKTLCITGAPRSKFARDFTLPARLWGTEADIAFLDSKHHKDLEGELIDTIVELTRLKKPIAGWQPIGMPEPAARTWRYLSFDPLAEKDKLHPRIGPPKRLRDVTMPEGTDGWHRPGFDDSAWKSGKAPIGVGEFKAHGHGRMWTKAPDNSFGNNSDWGDGEFLLMRTTFDVPDPDVDCLRIRILSDQGYHIYLNGEKIHSYGWFQHYPEYENIMLTEPLKKHLKKGANTLAVHCNVRFEQDREIATYHRVGQIDLSIEGLKTEDLELPK